MLKRILTLTLVGALCITNPRTASAATTVNALLEQETITQKNYLVSHKNTLSWDKVEGATIYLVSRSTSENGTYETITSTANTTYTDKALVPKKHYYYKITAFEGIDTGTEYYSLQLGQSPVLDGGSVAAMQTPSLKAKRKGKRITFTFKKAEGTKMQTQYRFLNTKKWKKLSTMCGNIKKTIRKKINASGFQVRVRTYRKVGKKKYYSKWSNKITIN